jgi:hypothetical protein
VRRPGGTPRGRLRTDPLLRERLQLGAPNRPFVAPIGNIPFTMSRYPYALDSVANLLVTRIRFPHLVPKDPSLSGPASLEKESVCCSSDELLQ